MPSILQESHLTSRPASSILPEFRWQSWMMTSRMASTSWNRTSGSGNTSNTNQHLHSLPEFMATDIIGSLEHVATVSSTNYVALSKGFWNQSLTTVYSIHATTNETNSMIPMNSIQLIQYLVLTVINNHKCIITTDLDLFIAHVLLNHTLLHSATFSAM